MGAPGTEQGVVAELRRSERRLQHLYDIGKVLLRFQTIDETVPQVVALVADTVPLRSAIFVQTRQAPFALAFQAKGDPPQTLRDARAHAEAAYRFLVPSGIALDGYPSATLGLPQLASDPAPPDASQFVLLPFIVSRGSIFGALQVQGVQRLDERDLVFVSAVVDQLATALERDASDRQLRASQEKLAGIVSMATDAVITVDPQMKIVLSNEGAERIFGWSAEEMLGKPIELLLPERLGVAHRAHMREFYAASDRSRRMGARRPEIIGRRKNGEEFPADAGISKLTVAGSTLCTVILRDISEQKRAENEASYLAEVSAVLGASLDHEATLHNVGRMAMRELADFCVVELVDERGELTGLELAAVEPSRAEDVAALTRAALDPSRSRPSSTNLRARWPAIIEQVSAETLRAISKDDAQLGLFEAMGFSSLMGVPLMVGGRSLGALIVASCRPGHCYGAADLQLLRKVGERAALALESARLYRVAQHAVQMRDEVLGVVAHDLRNPLGSILLQAALLRRQGVEPERRSRKPGHVIERAALRMNRLIQDLLDVTSMDAGHLSIERSVVPVAQLLRDLQEGQSPLVASRFLSLQFEPVPAELVVCADRERLLQVLENLIGNAAKFTPSGGRIAVGARERQHDVLFWVTDTGAGIAAADVPYLFDRFWQGQKAERRGAGLGLAIVKGLVESHGGRIWVESKLGSGSTFYFTIAPVQA
jgi:PAS domain S-box-containing protein